MGSLQVHLKTLELVTLVASFSSLHIIEFLVSLDLSPHLSSLNLDHLNFLFQVADLGSQVSILVALRDVLVTKTTGLEELLVQQSFGSLHFISQIIILLGLFLEQVLKVFKLLAVIGNLIHAAVKSGAVLDFRSGSLVSKHLVAAFHVEDIVIDTSVISLLILEIIELLSELSNELIFLARSKFNT